MDAVSFVWKSVLNRSIHWSAMAMVGDSTSAASPRLRISSRPRMVLPLPGGRDDMHVAVGEILVGIVQNALLVVAKFAVESYCAPLAVHIIPSRCGWRPCCMLHCISVRHESIDFEPQIDGENDAGDYGGGAHDVCGNLAGDGRGDVPADEASDAQHDGGRPIDRALDDEYH